MKSRMAVGAQVNTLRNALANKYSIALIGFILLLLRKPSALTEPYIWAEDGAIFLQQNLDSGLNTLTSYAGQLWFQQRVLTAIFRLAPLEIYPTVVYFGSAAVTVLILGVILQSRSNRIFVTRAHRNTAFLLCVLLPGAFEATNGILSTYLWLPISLSLVILFPEPLTRIGKIAQYTYIALGLLTSLTAIFILPAAIFSFIKEKSARTLFVLVATIGMAAAAIIGIRQSGRPITSHIDLVAISQALIRKSSGILIFGANLVDKVLQPGLSFFWLTLLFSLCLLALLLRSKNAIIWSLIIGGSMNAVLGILASVDIEVLGAGIPGGRYFITLNAAIILMLLIVAKTTQKFDRILAMTLIAICSLGFIADFFLPVPEALPPGTWKNFSNCIESKLESTCEIPVAPGDPWKIKHINKRLPAPHIS